MNEEEKEAIECLELVIDSETDIETEDLTNKCINNILNLIKKLQKEIEELEDKNKTLERLLQGNLYEMYKYYRELANSYQANCIIKDKIREIREKYRNDYMTININNRSAGKTFKQAVNYEVRKVIDEMLGE